MTDVLVIDDELAILRALSAGLRARGYEVRTAQTATEGLEAIASHPPDAIVLDLGLPDRDGVDVCRQLRTWTWLPIVVLSVDADEGRKVAALDAGADDYVTKPFGMAELDARLRVAVRNARRASTAQEASTLDVGSLHLDLLRRTVSVAGRPVDLTARELDLLAHFARNAGKVLTHRSVLAAVWGPGHERDIHHLRVYASRLRQKLGPDAPLLLTSPGVGYRLVDPT